MADALGKIAVVPVLGLVICWAVGSFAAHPGLLLAPEDIALIRQSIDQSPGFAKDLAAVRLELDTYFGTFPDVPPPVDAGGGYSHETHKRNGIAIHDAGIAHQLTGEMAYADYARQLLLAYAELYPGLGRHPQSRGPNPGRLFWQNLNESVWLTYAIQGFDAIHDALPPTDRERIVNKLLRPMADFLSEGSPGTFDRIHNHGTWAVAAVGMTGYAIDEPEYVRKALHGLNGDGGSGFLKQIDLLFSPDGYYGEGPYYQRYALMPFLLFARSIEANDPGREIFAYRDGILLKAIHACINLSYDGLFFPINDAIKDKGLDTVELRHGVAIAYRLTGDAELLSIAGGQKSFVLNGDGFALARALDRGESTPYAFRSRLFRDGPEGKRGGLAVLRGGDGANPQAAVLKATSQGMGHGHFDKLGVLFFDNGNEILTDYGAARFLNVAQKNGGRYLPENETWAKQTIAHNALVVDETSHFRGELAIAEQAYPIDLHFDSGGGIELAGATMADAYEDVSFRRTVAVLDGLNTEHPVLIDLLKADGKGRRQFDLPVHFNGQIINVSHPPDSDPGPASLRPLGDANGYQHLWLRARAEVAAGETFSITWLTGDRFYTYSTIALDNMEVFFTELGANDPQFNLRREQALVFRVGEVDSASFVAVLEPHGEYNGAEEFTRNSGGLIEEIGFHSEAGLDAVALQTADGARAVLALSHDADDLAAHTIDLQDQSFQWRGYHALLDATPVDKE